ncbi:chloramphenicol phosphotransferase CPT family protein [Phenylobacterium terrae]|uniref:Chloramphenicol phosphotransferase CPT family protein n=1 Tax=Phenylobacterium terrae TaxID=2665495 RepID=A0ABW4MZE7_9CAUL
MRLLSLGRIVVLNGVPRAGKSSIARALQARGPWLNLGVDLWRKATPDDLQPGIGLRPGGERPDLEPAVARFYAALWDAVAGVSRGGMDVACDVGLHTSYAHPLDTRALMRERLAGLPLLLVGVRCSLDVILERRGEDGAPREAVLRWQAAVHADIAYDLEVDASTLTPEACAEAILARLA